MLVRGEGLLHGERGASCPGQTVDAGMQRLLANRERCRLVPLVAVWIGANLAARSSRQQRLEERVDLGPWDERVSEWLPIAGSVD
jgi:hypothetical protein